MWFGPFGDSNSRADVIFKALQAVQLISTLLLALLLLSTGTGLTPPTLLLEFGAICIVSWLLAILLSRPLPVWVSWGIAHTRAEHLNQARWILCGVVALIWGAVYWAKYVGFELGNFDAGIYSTVAYNSSLGSFFFSSVQQQNHLGEHFSPVMLLFAPLFRLHPDVRWLLLAQLSAYCLTPWPLDRLVRRAAGVGLGSRTIASVSFCLSLLWFAYPPMQAAMKTPFHPSSLAAPFILFSLLWWRQRQFGRFVLGVGFLTLFKENLVLVPAGLGLHLIFQRQVRWGLVLMITAVVVLFCTTQLFIPWVAGDDYSKLERLAPFTAWPVKFDYLQDLLAPLGFLPLLHWRYGLLALPSLLQNLASGYEPMLSLKFHYDDLTAPLLFAALPEPLFLWWFPRLQRRKVLPLLMACLLLIVVFGSIPKSPLTSLINDPPSTHHRKLHQRLRQLQSTVPVETWIVSQHALGPYLHHPLHRPFTATDTHCSLDGISPGSLIVLAEGVNDSGIADLSICLETLASDPDVDHLASLEPLKVFTRRQSFS